MRRLLPASARVTGTAQPLPGASATAGGMSVQSAKPIVRVKHYGSGVLAVLALVFVAVVLWGLARNQNIKWSVVGDYLFNGAVLQGLLTTLEMTVLAMVLALVVAVIVAIMRISRSRVVQSIAAAYIFVFRGIPVIVQVIFWGNIGLFVRTINVSVPFTDWSVYSAQTADLITPFVASVAGLGLAESGYMAEIIRGGLLSVDRGQRQAARALGMTERKTLRLIIIPQALRVIVPPTGNQLISMLKTTAVVSIIGGGDLLTKAENISGLNYRTIELLIVATIWYLAVIVVMSVGQFFIERRVAEK